VTWASSLHGQQAEGTNVRTRPTASVRLGHACA